MLRFAWITTCCVSGILCVGCTWMWRLGYQQTYLLLRRDDRIEGAWLWRETCSVAWGAGRIAFGHRRTGLAAEDQAALASWVADRAPERSTKLVAQRPQDWLEEDYARSAWGADWARRGWALYRVDRVTAEAYKRERRLIVPSWLPAAVTSVLPACWLAGVPFRFWCRRRVARRQRLGLCVRCGYDLRSGPEASSPPLARCPECGHEREGARGEARGGVASASPSPSS